MFTGSELYLFAQYDSDPCKLTILSPSSNKHRAGARADVAGRDKECVVILFNGHRHAQQRVDRCVLRRPPGLCHCPRAYPQACFQATVSSFNFPLFIAISQAVTPFSPDSFSAT
jgi:hypothetical protein